ncbi:MAG: DUF3793 family protein [Dorea sp.]|jgi:hypothetical protein|nr:DUF3793 family protein [Dorea sp.]
MSEETFVRCCSPTLAGIKTANLFSCHFSDEREMRDSLRELNGILVKKGIRVLSLRYRDGCALIYTYRPSKLLRDLQQSAASRLLKERGYTFGAPERYIVQLVQRLEDDGEFPHEIGLFLGYPPEDVYGFIENRAEGYKCAGEWKVYGDVDKAKKMFAKYRKCKEVYCAQFAQGKSIERLTEAV